MAKTRNTSVRTLSTIYIDDTPLTLELSQRERRRAGPLSCWTVEDLQQGPFYSSDDPDIIEDEFLAWAVELLGRNKLIQESWRKAGL